MAEDVRFKSRRRDKLDPNVFATIVRRFGKKPDIDAFASDENHQLERYWTKKVDGLKKDWKGTVLYINPPWELLDRIFVKIV